MKIEQKPLTLTEDIPSYSGRTFISWNTEAKGTGDSYEPGAIYDKDEDLTLYAQWDMSKYAVTLNPNHGTLAEESVMVTYNMPYGELPTPTRDQYEFAGWFTELDGGEQITDKSIVELAEDHTLYAHWDSSIPYISSIVMRTDSYHTIRTTAYRIPQGILFACGYVNGQMTDAVSVSVEQTDGFMLTGDFDTIRVFALDSETHRPLCSCNVISERQFISS